ncbi:MAG: squalene/phytoene synthase family protein [Pararhodobacter sp.]|nr:squalene/phytoene synthase family protein [Pararhodobacter sp.]
MNADRAITACAELVQRGDLDRFLATMAAPPPVRPALFTLYAANLEIARAPWVTSEPMIAQMRLQFWRDVIANPASPRAHDIAAPLALLITEKALPQEAFERLIAAREADLARAPFADEAALWAYLEDTAGSLMALALRAFGTCADEMASDWGAAQGLANYLLAVPALLAAGRQPLPDTRPETIAALAQTGLSRLAKARASTKSLPRAARPALLAAWRAGPLLRQAARYPDRVTQGTLGQSEFTRRLTLIRASLTGP